MNREAHQTKTVQCVAENRAWMVRSLVCVLSTVRGLCRCRCLLCAMGVMRYWWSAARNVRALTVRLRLWVALPCVCRVVQACFRPLFGVVTSALTGVGSTAVARTYSMI